MVAIRRIEAHQWQLLRQIRLAALADAPDAFGASLDEERQLPASDWRQRARDGTGDPSCCALAFSGEQAIGLAVGLANPQSKELIYLVSMWVAPDWRGTAVAGDLVRHIADWARDRGAAALLLGVTPGNKRALAFYHKQGFAQWDGRRPEHPAVTGCDLVLGKPL